MTPGAEPEPGRYFGTPQTVYRAVIRADHGRVLYRSRHTYMAEPSALADAAAALGRMTRPPPPTPVG